MKSLVLPISRYTTLYFLFILVLSNMNVQAQDLEVIGKAKITSMDKVDNADSVVVRLADGTLGVRDVSTLTDDDADPANELQLLSINGDTIFISNGNYLVIPGLSNVSLIPTCEDNIMNGNETDVDCGGPACAPCPLLDIILVVDNSGDMATEIENVKDNINRFADSLTASIIDWRLILISQFSSICFPPPLNPGCGGSPVNTSNFYHYSTNIGSHDALCEVIDGFTNPDEFNLTPNGWQDWLRAGASKAFIIVTTDGVNCTTGITNLDDSNTEMGGNMVADDFEMALANLSTTHFGTVGNPNYQFFSVVGISSLVLQPGDPIQISTCINGVDPGTGYQAMSINTDAQRYSTCTVDYAPVFDNIANELINDLTGN